MLRIFNVPASIVYILTLVASTGCLQQSDSCDVDTVPLNAIYVIDTSGSMKEDGLYRRLIDELETKYITHLDDNDRCVFMTFDNETRKLHDFRRSDEASLANAVTDLKRIAPDGDYTYLTGAVYEASRLAEQLQAAHPDHMTEVYLFTDGKNDPPPGATGPTDWETVLSDEFAGGIIKRPDVAVYVVALPGASLPDVPDTMVVRSPPDGQGLMRSELKFETTRFEMEPVEISKARDGSIPRSQASRELEIKIRVAVARPAGEVKEITLDPVGASLVDPRQLDLKKRGQKKTLRVEYDVTHEQAVREIRLDIRPASLDLDCDDAFVIRVPLKFLPYKAPLWKRVLDGIMGLPVWLLVVLGVLLLLLLACLLSPKFKRQTIDSGGIVYKLRRRAKMCGGRVALGPPSGIPLGDGRTVAVLVAGPGGRVTLHRKAKGLRVNGMDVERKTMSLSGFATIEYDGASVDFSNN